MRDGHILQLGSPDEVYNNPVDMFVAGFMGSPSMNFIRATLVAAGEGYALRIATQRRLICCCRGLPLAIRQGWSNGWKNRSFWACARSISAKRTLGSPSRRKAPCWRPR